MHATKAVFVVFIIAASVVGMGASRVPWECVEEHRGSLTRLTEDIDAALEFERVMTAHIVGRERDGLYDVARFIGCQHYDGSILIDLTEEGDNAQWTRRTQKRLHDALRTTPKLAVLAVGVERLTVEQLPRLDLFQSAADETQAYFAIPDENPVSTKQAGIFLTLDMERARWSKPEDRTALKALEQHWHDIYRAADRGARSFTPSAFVNRFTQREVRLRELPPGALEQLRARLASQRATCRTDCGVDGESALGGLSPGSSSPAPQLLLVGIGVALVLLWIGSGSSPQRAPTPASTHPARTGAVGGVAHRKKEEEEEEEEGEGGKGKGAPPPVKPRRGRATVDGEARNRAKSGAGRSKSTGRRRRG